MIDAHIHLEQYDTETIKHQIDKWRSEGIQAVIAVSNDLASSYRTLELQNKYHGFVYAAVGFHPEKPLPKEADFLEWINLISTERENITAIGEIGLPHYNLENLPHSLDHALEFLSRCLDVARNKNLPVVLHAVHDKASIALKLLRDYRINTAHFHWLKSPKDVLERIIKTGYYISVTPEVCYRKRDQDLARTVPLSQLLIETDGPWPYDNKFNDYLTTPLFLKDTIHSLENIKGFSSKQIQEQTVKNTRRSYQIENNGF